MRQSRAWSGLLIAIFVALMIAPLAGAYRRSPKLESVASVFALRATEVRCPSTAEWQNDALAHFAWSYYDKPGDYIVVRPDLCTGALHVSDVMLPAWQRALGVLTLTHEAYHARRWRYRFNEAKVECQAIRHFEAAAMLLGASEDVADDLLPVALAAHRHMTEVSIYLDPHCELPSWQPPR